MAGLGLSGSSGGTFCPRLSSVMVIAVNVLLSVAHAPPPPFMWLTPHLCPPPPRLCVYSDAWKKRGIQKREHHWPPPPQAPSRPPFPRHEGGCPQLSPSPPPPPPPPCVVAAALSVTGHRRFYVFTTEFYHMLCKAGKNMETCARTWAKNVALFKKPFVLVPINEQKHWTLLLICNLPALASAHGPGAGRAPFPPGSPTAGLPSVAADGAAPPGAAGTGEPPPATHPASPAGAPTFSDAGRDGACDPPGRAAPPGAAGASSLLQRGCYMLYLDSFRLNGDRHFRTIRRFLRHRYASEFGMEWGIPEALLPGRSPDVPMQHNQSDCGVYMLHFAERLARFLPQSPDSPVEEVVEALECPPSHIQNLRWQMQQKLKAVAPAEVMQHLQEYEELWEKVPPANDHIVAL